MRTRWICLGTVQGGRALTSRPNPFPGGCKGWLVNWRGRMAWCQPWQFVWWEDMFTAAVTRLKLNARGLRKARGLVAVSWASRLPRTEFQEMWCEVRLADKPVIASGDAGNAETSAEDDYFDRMTG